MPHGSPDHHVSADTLALLALGEDAATPVERTHLTACAHCAALLAEMRDAVAVGRTTLGVERLVAPPPRVWAAVATELGLPADVAPPGDAPPAPSRRPSIRRRVLLTGAAAAVAGAAVAWFSARSAVPDRVVRADLVHLPGWTGSSGRAELDEYADGHRIVRVTTNLRPDPSGQHAVWLMDAATGARLLVGLLQQGSGTFAVPARVDLTTFSSVDVSAQPKGAGDRTPGRSIIRGALHA